MQCGTRTKSFNHSGQLENFVTLSILTRPFVNCCNIAITLTNPLDPYNPLAREQVYTWIARRCRPCRAFRAIKLQAAIIFLMATVQTWDPASYARNARFVSDLGSPVVDLLAPKPGERILDLGCGDGVLTKKLVDLGCEVVAVDSSLPQVEAARKLGLNAHVISGEDLQYKEEFDAVFSNAVLHWIKRADVVLAGVHRSLKPGGRFVAECGGHGCVHKIRAALVQALDRRGFDGEARVPWYFPTPGDYATRLERAGFRVDSIALIPRPTPLPGDVAGWLETFALDFFQGFSDEGRSEYLQEVRTVLEPQLRDANGIWVADYVRLRFAATKAPDSES
jgi:trans-aconitate methyltransferase